MPSIGSNDSLQALRSHASFGSSGAALDSDRCNWVRREYPADEPVPGRSRSGPAHRAGCRPRRTARPPDRGNRVVGADRRAPDQPSRPQARCAGIPGMPRSTGAIRDSRRLSSRFCRRKARVTSRPSTSPSQPSCAARLRRAWRSSSISSRRGSILGLMLSVGQRKHDSLHQPEGRVCSRSQVVSGSTSSTIILSCQYESRSARFQFSPGRIWWNRNVAFVSLAPVMQRTELGGSSA